MISEVDTFEKVISMTQRRRKRLKRTETPTLNDILKGDAIPELPSEYRKKLWQTIRIKSEIRLTEETEHYINVMCLHFGLSRSDLVLHAVNLLWQQVASTIDANQLAMYEDKLEVLRLYKLEQMEFLSDVDRLRKKKVVDQWNRENPGQEVRNLHGGVTWWWDYTKKPNGERHRDGALILLDKVKFD